MAVLLIMFVGAIAAVLIAGTVIFTIQSNTQNKASTQAFIAAESGRDAVLANVLASTCTLTASNPLGSAAGPFYTAQADHCPSSTGTDTFTITSTGFDVNGDSTKITAVYERLVTYENQPGGSLAYIDGTFTVTHASYAGTVVVRHGDYDCGTSKSTIDGDLWVLNGQAILSQGCTVTGNVYAKGNVQIGSNSVTVGGGITTAGSVVASSTNGLSVGVTPLNPRVTGDTDIRATGDINLSNVKGTIAGNVTAGGTYTPGSSSLTIGGTAQGGQPDPAVFVPTLQQVYDMTTWVDISANRGQWGDDVEWYDVPAGSCAADMTAQLKSALPAGKTRWGIDYSSCGGDVTVTIGGSVVVPHDTLFLIPGNRRVTVNMGGTITSPVGQTTQLFVIHADSVPDQKPTCVNGPASDTMVAVPETGVNLMFYTPCGIPKITGSFKDTFHGQYYSGSADGSNWVQPEFTCVPMAWQPLVDLSCNLTSSDTGPHGTLVQVQKPIRLTQAEE
ncbi:hypothetical protein [Microbacterium terrisoli]|uniref:hypothetical protein n=1 Tax=Microbacterium terrisoli TaxID=3242192 RepID=UPI002803D096|nr:hypothetical protein [Microbacterium protaetiae]